MTPGIDAAPLAGPRVPTGSDEEPSRRRRLRREEKRRRDAVRRPESRERFRILEEVVEEERHALEIANHKARCAPLILGVLNVVMFVLLGRGGILTRLPAALEPWLLGRLAIYAALTLTFVHHAIDWLRAREIGGGVPVHRLGVPGRLFWEGIVQYDAASSQREWSAVRMDQLNAEAALLAHRVAGLIRAKYRARSGGSMRISTAGASRTSGGELAQQVLARDLRAGRRKGGEPASQIAHVVEE